MTTTGAVFQYWKDKAGRYRFRFMVDDSLLLTSQAYEDLESAMQDMDKIRDTVETAEVVEV